MSAIPPLLRDRFAVGACAVDPAAGTLEGPGGGAALEPRVMDVLCALAEHPGEVRLRHEILDRVWGTTGGTDETLSRAVSIIRKAFRDAGAEGAVIETVPRRGYRLAQAVTPLKNEASAPPPTGAVTPSARRRLPPTMIGAAAAALAIVVGVGLWQGDRPSPTRADADIAEAPDETGAPSIAVLPFRDFSPEQDQRWFAEGIAEELLNGLARTEGLRVASRTSAFSFTDDETPVGDIADALGVRHVLEGSVRKDGNKLRITAQLIDTRTDRHLWSDTFDRDLSPDAVFAVQDEIAQEIVSQLLGSLEGFMTTGEAPTRSQRALELYLRARAAHQGRDADGIERAIADLTKAVRLDPAFARAHAELARVHRLSGYFTDTARSRADTLADVSLERAIALAPDDPEVLTATAWVQHGRRPPSEVIPLFDAALAANPGDAEAYRGRAGLRSTLGDYDGALADFETATRIDPQSVPAWTSLAFEHERAGRRAERDEALAEVLRLDPDSPGVLRLLAGEAIDEGDLPLAHRIAKQGERHAVLRHTLNYIYYETDLRDLIRDPSDDLRADMAFADGDDDRALVIANAPDTAPVTRIRALYHANELRAAAAVFGGDYVAERYLPMFDDPEALAEAVKQDASFTSIVMAYKAFGDPVWKRYSAALVAAYEASDPPPGGWDYSKAIALATHGDIDGAMRAAETFLARGTGKLVAEVDPGFAPLRDDPRWPALVAMNEAKRAEHRAAIQAQLADPPRPWWQASTFRARAER